ncbi:YihY/virulence factor BrkB family protein [Pedobacter agri]|uniref:YihY/virulence factor BrkB family protein n=1 Tax=Pedobacter agri TaxID=454586 RepID=A0A9X3I9R9_9SPHI|nr:YihY/virulence factor BrkB family protein [Pedobacter agri]MCX3264838.1 YihY/virulence factor BrkB family protein [Pedobacter agri]
MNKLGRDIKNIEELATQQLVLKKEIEAGKNRIKNAVQEAAWEIPVTITQNLTKTPFERNLESLSDPAGKLLPELSSLLVNKIIPRKVGFFKRIMLTSATKFLIRKALKPYATVTAPKPEPIKQLRVPRLQMTSPALKIQAKENTENPTAKENKRISLKGLWQVLKTSFTGFGDHKVTKISGSLAYYTVFSMGPLLVVIISLCGIFMKKEAAQGKVFEQLKGFLGSETALQLQEIIKSAGLGDKGTIAFIIGLITLLLGATTVFGDIQDSINTIWGIKPKPKRGWLKMLQNRFLSFSVIVSLGFLLLVSLGVTAVLDGFSNRLQNRFADVSVVFFYILNTVITLGVVSAIFAVIFKVLPDANIKWRDVAAGALVTGVLFLIGKLGISLYISKSDVGSTYGAAGSLVVLLLWTYYSSIILYFGAEFTKSYAVAYGSEILPNHYAVTIKEIEVEQGSKSVQDTHVEDDK